MARDDRYAPESDHAPTAHDVIRCHLRELELLPPGKREHAIEHLRNAVDACAHHYGNHPSSRLDRHAVIETFVHHVEALLGNEAIHDWGVNHACPESDELRQALNQMHRGARTDALLRELNGAVDALSHGQEVAPVIGAPVSRGMERKTQEVLARLRDRTLPPGADAAAHGYSQQLREQETAAPAYSGRG